MADRYDPRLSVRPGGERRISDARGAATASDPLAELAKLVSGRSGSGSATQRAKPANDAAASPSGGDVLGDLETELLNDLQASFAAVRDLAAAPPAAQPVPQSPPPARATTPPPAMRSSGAEAVRSEPVRSEPVRAERPPLELGELFAPLRQLQPQPSTEAPAVEPPRLRTEPRLDAPVRPASFRSQPSEPVPAERTARAGRAAGSGEKPDLGSFQLRPSSEAAPSPTASVVPRQPRSRWDKPEPANAAPAAGSRFAPPRTPPASVRPPLVDDEDLGSQDEDGDFLAEIAEAGEEDFPLEGFGDFEETDRHAPFADESLESMIEPRRSRGVLLVAGVVGLVVIGGIAVAMFRPAGTATGTPPVIVADGQPTKITPDDTAAADAEAQNKLIYDRVNSGEENAETTLVTPGNEAIAPVPSDNSSSNPITRVIIPGGPGYDQPASDDGLSLDGQPSTLPPEGAAAAEVGANDAEDSAIQAIGPRKVRTVIVKPDGTIVENVVNDTGEGATASDTAAGPPAVPAASPAEAAPAVVAEAATSQPVNDDTNAIAGGSGNGELQITPVPDAGGSTVAAVDNPPVVAPPPAPPPAPAPAQQQQTVVAAVDKGTAPIDLTQGPAAGPAPSTVSGGMLVQVSSQRSEDAARATYRDLQARYPGILGSYDANIQRADLPDRGTFFRVRVGPFSASDAQRLCNDLKAAGGDCILAQR